MAPFDFVASFGKVIGYLVFLLVGVGFGAVLEMSGFGDSRKLAAQFYLKDMTVLKVMFTGIIVAMVLIFSFASMELLDFSRIYVNPTYLVPGIIGGLIMGVGFIIGGFCPGTSVVALATLKIDGILFAAGVACGAFLFGESLSIFQGFHNSSYMGRYMLPEFLGIKTGIVILLLVLMALTMFYWAEIAEKIFGEKKTWKQIPKMPGNKSKIFASAALVFVALLLVFSGQPTPQEKWQWIEKEETIKLEKREVYIHPGELLEVMNDPMLYSRLLDVRSETDYNLFHLENARRITPDHIQDPGFIKKMENNPVNTVVVVMANGEQEATRFYKLLRGQGILNVYILEGGVNNWLSYFPLASELAVPMQSNPEDLAFTFAQSVGANADAANPGIKEGIEKKGLKFPRKIKIQKKKLVAGGCG